MMTSETGNQLMRMLPYSHLRSTEEVKVYDLPSSEASHVWSWPERRSTFGNDDTQNDSLRKDFVRVYKDREYYHQQRDELNNKLETSSCCDQELNRHCTYERPLDDKMGDQDSSTYIVTFLKSENEYLKRKMTLQNKELFDLKNNLESERYTFQDERAKSREKDDQLKVQEHQLQYRSEEIQNAKDCLDEMVSVLKGILNKNMTGIHYTHPQREYKLLVRRDDKLFDLMRKLQQKFREVQERMIDMARTILRLQRDHREIPVNRLHIGMEYGYLRKDRLIQHMFDKMNQRAADYRECISSLKNDKQCLEEEVTLLKDTLKCHEKEKKNLNKKILKMTSDKLSDGLKQSSREINFYEAKAEPNESLARLEKELMFREAKVKKYEEEYRNKINELKDKTIFLERQVWNKDDQLSELRHQQEQTLKSLREENTSLKKETQDLKAEVERCNFKIKDLRETLDRSSKELKDQNEQLMKIKKEREELLSKQTDNRSQASKQILKTEADSNDSYKALMKEIQRLEQEVKTKDSEVKYLGKMLDSNKVSLGVLDNKIQEKNNQLLEQSVQHRHAVESLRGKKVDYECRNDALKKTIQHLEAEVERCNQKNRGLEETLDRKKKEISDTNERYVHAAKEKDAISSQFSDLRQRTNRTYDSVAEFNQTVTSLKVEKQNLDKQIKLQDANVQNLEKQLERRNVNLEEKISQLENKIQVKDDQLSAQSYKHQQAVTRLHAKESELEEINQSLKKKIRHLEAEVERCFETKRVLEETLDNNKKEMIDTNERYANAAKEKDAISSKFSDLRERTYKADDSEAEFNKTVTALKAENQSLYKQIKLRDEKIQNLEKQLQSKNINRGERISQLENKIQEKDDQLSSQRYQHQQAVTRLHEKESELVISLKKKIQNLEAEVERSNREKRVLEETLDRKKKETNDTNERYVKAVKEKDAFSSQHNDPREQTFKTYYSEAESNRTISALKVENKNLAEEINLRDAKVKDIEKQLQSKNRNLEEKIRQLENTIHAKDGQLSAQSNQHQQVVRRLNEEESKLKATIISLEKKINDLEANAQRLVSKINDLEEQLKKSKIVAKAGLKGDLPAMENMIAGLKQELKQTRTKLRDTEAELNETKTRLSKAMGERLTDNNPNITDLGDKNRPTKLAERFAELYDNQWTDAFDILEKKFDTEEKAIEALLHILQDAMNFCKTKEREQMEELRRVLVFADKTVPRGEAIDIQRLFKENRKAVASSAVENLLQAYEAHIRRSADERIQMAKDVKSYAKECLEICWLMTVQDPPVVFAPLLKKGVQFNNELFRPYTKSGSNVAFVVWPALLLHENGPVLAKGVAQGAGKP